MSWKVDKINCRRVFELSKQNLDPIYTLQDTF